MTDLSMIRGDSAVFDLAFTDDVGTALDLDGMDIAFVAKRYWTSPDAEAVIVKQVGDGIEVDADPSTGLATLTLEPADTSGLDDRVRRLRFDVELTDGPDVHTPIQGVLVVSPDIAHSDAGS